jgi:DNA-binding transcriptional MocR family regulator
MSHVMRVALERGLCDQTLAKLVTGLQQRAAKLVKILQSDERIHITTLPMGGYFVWITFPQGCSATDVLEYCQQKKTQVSFFPGDRFDSFATLEEDARKKQKAAAAVGGGGGGGRRLLSFKSGLKADLFRRSARLCFADINIEDLEVGAKAFVKAFQEYMIYKNPY